MPIYQLILLLLQLKNDRDRKFKVVIKLTNRHHTHMRSIPFHKYHGAGNDFILLRQTGDTATLKEETIHLMCHRHYGIGADGLIVLKESEVADFEMIYYNADGKEGSMCGNGGRCAALYAYNQKLCSEKMVFMAYDGVHKARIISKNDYEALVELQLSDVTDIRQEADHYFIDTGSPHYIAFRQNIKDIDMDKEAKSLRHHYREGGTNVNFIEKQGGHYSIRTYERGVEKETLSCGTGITAAAIAIATAENLKQAVIPIQAPGGTLEVSLKKAGNGFEEIWLKGPAMNVFEGTIKIT